jgi:hypothetical protein
MADYEMEFEDNYEDTIAYRVVSQIIDHMYGDLLQLDDSGFLIIIRAFWTYGGSWERLIMGNPADVNLLKDLVDSYGEVVMNPDEYGLTEEG